MSPTSTIRRARLAGLLMLGITIVFPWLASAATPTTATRNTPLGLSSAAYVAPADPDRRLEVVFTLDLRDHSGAAALIEAQQDPDSALYHQWIEPEEFQARFGPLPSDIQAVKDYLGSQGFEKIDMPTSTMIAAEGTVAVVEQAFGVQINLYSFDGRTVFSNDRDPVLPSYLASKVLHVGGLDDLTVMRPQHGPVTEVPPSYTALGQNFILPRDNQVAYGQKAGYFDVGKKGTSGAELAVASSWDMQLSDVNDQLTRQGGAAAGYNLLTAAASGPHTISSTCIPNTGSGTGCTYVANGGLNDSVETNWDVSLASSIANDNHIGVYLSQMPTTTAFATMYQYIADRAGTIKVVTHSWGVCLSIVPSGDVQASENAFAQAAAGGQAWFVSTGDHGSNACNGNGGANPDVVYPAASPYVTAVGGSEQNTTAAGSFGADGWLVGYPANGEAACSEGGGGEATAATLPRPSWQSGTGVSGTGRLVPDVSMHYGMCTTPGAGKGYVVRLGANLLLGIGGTSGDAPQWAAFWAVANQVVGTNLGHAAPVLFRILRSEGGTSYANCFHDVTTGNNGAYPAGAGYDKATGIGTPKFNALYPALQTLFAPVASSCFTATTQADFSTGTLTNVSATASPGDVKLAITGGESLNGQNTSPLNALNAVTTALWLGQTFTPTVTGTLTRVDFSLACLSCSGVDPNITVELRGTSSGLPTSTVLASSTIAGFSSANIAYYTATFATPGAVTSGTTYAIVLRLVTDRTTGTYNVSRTSTDGYAGGMYVNTFNGGALWGGTSYDLGFRAYVTTPLVYASSGDLISDIKDSNPSASGTPHVTSLTWTAATPAGTTVKFQLATSSNPAGPFNYLGPDGTSATYFTTSPASPRGELFQGRYFRWRAYLSTTDTSATPTLSAVTACYNNTCTGLPSNPVVTNNGPICAGATLQLNASTIPGATYSWTGPGAFGSSLQNPSIAGATTANSGTYGVKATLGSCSSATVQTVATVIANGAACSDGNGCTQTDTCSSGACVGSNPVVCTVSNSCHKSGVCNPATGICSPETTRFNENCNDGNSCTTGDKCGITLTQNFDQAPTPDAIPAPWTTSVSGSPGDSAWVLDTHSSQTAPISAFADDPAHITDKFLVSPTFSYTSSANNAYVTFFLRYQLESTLDGAVLEISINNGPFNDITSVGGAFTAGGYTGVINVGRSNPIAGRLAWTGTSPNYPNYIQSTAGLPPVGAGQSVRLRWRVATDISGSGTGLNIDSITIVDDFPAMACTGVPAALPQEVGKILAQPDKILWNFDAALSATSYVAMRGLVSALPVGPGGGDELCSNLGASLQFQDVQVPPSATSYWYLVRGKNACGVGSWGTQSNGTPHVTTSCP